LRSDCGIIVPSSISYWPYSSRNQELLSNMAAEPVTLETCSIEENPLRHEHHLSIDTSSATVISSTDSLTLRTNSSEDDDMSSASTAPLLPSSSSVETLTDSIEIVQETGFQPDDLKLQMKQSTAMSYVSIEGEGNQVRRESSDAKDVMNSMVVVETNIQANPPKTSSKCAWIGGYPLLGSFRSRPRSSHAATRNVWSNWCDRISEKTYVKRAYAFCCCCVPKNRIARRVCLTTTLLFFVATITIGYLFWPR
jgi:hypothetical protein